MSGIFEDWVRWEERRSLKWRYFRFRLLLCFSLKLRASTKWKLRLNIESQTKHTAQQTRSSLILNEFWIEINVIQEGWNDQKKVATRVCRNVYCFSFRSFDDKIKCKKYVSLLRKCESLSQQNFFHRCCCSRMYKRNSKHTICLK